MPDSSIAAAHSLNLFSVFVNNSGKLPFNMTLALGSSISSFAEILAGVSDVSSSAQYLLKMSLGFES